MTIILKICKTSLLLLGVTALTLLASAGSANAASVTGTIVNDGKNPLQLRIKDLAEPIAVEAQLTLLAYLCRFRTGDWVSVQGTISADKKKIKIDMVDRVGLQELLGAWRSSRWEIFEFADYDRLNLYIPKSGGSGSISISRLRSLKYVVTPDQNNRYSIFISDDSDVKMGFLQIGDNQLTLTLTDSKTGRETENISLSPIRMQ